MKALRKEGFAFFLGLQVLIGKILFLKGYLLFLYQFTEV